MLAVNIQLVRTAAVLILCALAATALVKRQAVGRALRSYFGEETSAFNLGALRAVVFWRLFWATESGVTATYAALPASILKLPYGWRWAHDFIPFEPAITQRIETVFLIASALAFFGMWSRVSAPIAATLAIYVLGLPNFYLKFNHGNIATVLIACVVAVAPCGDALSLDRLWKRARGYAAPAYDRAYTVPVRLSWLILGTVYLFPGLWKLWLSGDLWIRGSELQGILYAQWAVVPDFVPLLRIDRSPLLLALFGTATLLFEIGFIFLLFNRYTRIIAALSATMFHASVAALMSIHFSALFPLVLLLDFPGIARLCEQHAPRLAGFLRSRAATWQEARASLAQRLRLPASTRAFPLRSALLSWIVGGALFAGQVVTGVYGVNSFPVAVHPTFSSRRGKSVPSVKQFTLMLTTLNGEKIDLGERLKQMGTPRRARVMSKLSSELRQAKSEDADGGGEVVAIVRASGTQLAAGDRIELWQASWKLLPLGERRGYRRKYKGAFLVTAESTLVPERRDKSKPSKK